MKRKILVLVLGGLLVAAACGKEPDASVVGENGELAAGVAFAAASLTAEVQEEEQGGTQKEWPEEASGAQEEKTEGYCEGLVFHYGDFSCDVRERYGDINAVFACEPVGKYIVLEGHVGPNNGVYCIFNTETLDFEPEIFGTNLTWHDDDIRTGVYAFWSEIYSYDGTLIANLELGECEYIYGITFIEENTALEVSVMTDIGECRKERIELAAVGGQG